MSTTAFFNKDSNPHQNKIELPPLPDWCRSQRDPQRNESRVRAATREAVIRLRVGLYRLGLLREFLLEIRSLLYRISILCKRRYDLFGLNVGPIHEIHSGYANWNTRTHACTVDMQNFLASRPWSTTIDLELYRDAWAQGEKWGACNFRKQDMETGS